MKNPFLRVALATFGTALLLTSLNACRRSSPQDQTPDTSTYRPESTPATQFERDLKFVRDGHFTHVWVFSRKDGKELTPEDSESLRTNAPKVVDWATTDGKKKVIGGSNFDIDPPNRERVKVMVGAPTQEHSEVGVGVGPGQALVPRPMGSDRHPEQIIRNTMEHNRIGHTPTVPA